MPRAQESSATFMPAPGFLQDWQGSHDAADKACPRQEAINMKELCASHHLGRSVQVSDGISSKASPTPKFAQPMCCTKEDNLQ